MSKISIIIPVYKAEKYIVRCLDSILSQTFKNFEVILVDDGSVDNSGTICEQYAQRDKRFVVLHQKNSGQAVARNNALDWLFKNSDSEWITFIDSDDWVSKYYLEILLDLAEKCNSNIAAGKYLSVDDNFIEKINDCQQMEYSLIDSQAFYTSNGVGVDSYIWSKLYRKELFLNLRFPVNRLWEDLSILYKLLLSEKQIPCAECNLYFYYQNPDSTLHKKWNKQRLDEFLAYEEQLSYLSHYKEYKFTYDVVQISYLSALQKQYFLISNSDLSNTDKIHFQKIVKKKIRKSLIKYSRNPRFSIKDCSCCYEIAFPNLMKIYWILRAQIMKLL